MSSFPTEFGRSSNLLAGARSLRTIQSTQAEIADAERQIATGKKVHRPSDAAGRASSVLYLRERIDAREQDQRNLDAAARHLLTAEQGLGEATDLLNEAHSLALAQVGVTSDPENRAVQATVVDGQIAGLQQVANRAFNTLPSFAGRGGERAGLQAFESFRGGIRYTGTADDLRTPVGEPGLVAFTSNGADAFGALDARVGGGVDLGPAASSATALADLGGGAGEGIRRGVIRVQVGAAAAVADLTDADTLGDAATRLTAAIESAAPGAGSVTVTPGGLVLGSAGPTITLTDPAGGFAAADLGVAGLTATAGTAAGADPAPRLTAETPLSALPGPLDLASGILVNQGGTEAVLDLSAATTVQDAQNAIEGLGLGLRLEVTADGRSLEIVQEVAGLELSLGENGGSTAADLGLTTFGAATALSSFRHGEGVVAVDGDDFTVTLADGTAFGVDLTGAATVSDVLGRTNAAAAAAGVGPADFNLSLAATGTGLVFQDNTAGPASMSVAWDNQSHALEHLGFPPTASAGPGGTLAGGDTATVHVANAFTHLSGLAASLRADDTAGISLAGTGLEGDTDRLIAARSGVAVRAAGLEDARERAIDLTETETAMLSELTDADLAEVISRYQRLQIQLQASMQTTAQSLRLSLFDYLG
ncbi:flagellin N-terminal helical domain-containing protein [Phycisphaera mikurensis]|uniref:Putative flagellar hook-associated protein 3 n=1 Tax=Phycisphaera mikurensis (strain NBRC 102666 / KCTC 22515 / FYK2301M01) TaxID=1142394 RepID=I0IAM6_PHYMF|nr:flagellin [Phycisphaera mikurensis]MBB6441690.1 flagellin-like hook-associated protein FlgL [Phycisphaera mikurensis]BAM02314.1 putative flagellar hook-associated protein 3 [Phycisphaera mikurensis NBRC 102666]